MSTRPTAWIAGVKRGRLTADDKAAIERLAENGDKTPWQIGYRVNRHPATVNWYMLTHGLIDREPRYATRAYERNGRQCHPYSPDEDNRLQELLVATQAVKQRGIYPAIAATLSAEFNTARNEHSVRVRAIQLAAAP